MKRSASSRTLHALGSDHESEQHRRDGDPKYGILVIASRSLGAQSEFLPKEIVSVQDIFEVRGGRTWEVGCGNPNGARSFFCSL